MPSSQTNAAFRKARANLAHQGDRRRHGHAAKPAPQTKAPELPIRRDILWDSGADAAVGINVPTTAKVVNPKAGRCYLIFWYSPKGGSVPIHVYAKDLGGNDLHEAFAGRKIAGRLEVWSKTFADGRVEFYIDANVVPDAKPTHRLKVHSRIEELDPDAASLFTHPVYQGVLAVTKIVPKNKKPEPSTPPA